MCVLLKWANHATILFDPSMYTRVLPSKHTNADRQGQLWPRRRPLTGSVRWPAVGTGWLAHGMQGDTAGSFSQHCARLLYHSLLSRPVLQTQQTGLP